MMRVSDLTKGLCLSSMACMVLAARAATPLVSFNAPRTYPVDQNPRAVAVGDFNRDGKPDLAVATGSGNIAVLLGNGAGTFRPAVEYPVGSQAAYVVAGDFNADGKLDLATANI